MPKESKEKNIEEKKIYEKTETKDIFKVWSDSLIAVSKVWEDSYTKLYKPWVEFAGEMSEKAVEISINAAPKQYKEFYDEWVKTYQNTFGTFYPISTLQPDKDILKKFLGFGEDLNKLYVSWIKELEENSRKTSEILKGKPDPAKYKECYDMWTKSYEQIFDGFLQLPAMKGTKEMFEKYTGVPDIYSNFMEMSKLWKETYTMLYTPWIESMLKLSGKMAEISQGATPEAYKEFYDIWMNTYKELYGKYFLSAQPSKEVFENFAQSTEIYLNMYKSWITALEKMSEKALELSKQTADPEAYKEFFNLWVKMYEKAFDSFFEDMPVMGPMKGMIEPVRMMAKIYSDVFAKMSKMWVKIYFPTR